MIKPSQSTHWYTPSGEPAYNATLRDARKETLYPSVTQVIGMLDKPFIGTWMVNLMSEVCYKHPVHQPEDFLTHWESIDEYRSRIEPIFNELRSRAAILGTAVHDYAEAAMKGMTPPVVEGCESSCLMLSDWIMANIGRAKVEQSFSHCTDQSHKRGFGGRVDAYGELKDGRPFLLDFKTQGVKGKPTYYPEWLYQIGAYAMGLNLFSTDTAYLSVVIDTNQPGLYIKEYTEADVMVAVRTFKAILNAWYAVKGL